MKRFLVGTVINCLGLWLVTLVIPAIKIAPWGGDTTWNLVASFAFVGMIFGLVTAIVAPVIKVLAFPLYILTFGLISFVINGAILLLVAWLSQLINSPIFSIDGFTQAGLTIDSLGWAMLGSIIMSVFAFFARGIFKVLRIL
jgi:putative membrane protein